jgi:hypothetical protein
MSSTALSHLLIVGTLLITTCSPGAQAAGRALSCETAKDESAALAQAPMGASRAGPHVLEVNTKAGSRTFNDKPPHDEGGLAGIHWRYCGYDAQAKAHLIQKTDEGLFTGVLLLDETGKVLPAGRIVLFSPDKRKFLSIEQADGMDGENWSVHSDNGKALWQGFAGMIEHVDGIDTVVSTFKSPRWTGSGDLTADFVCASRKKTGLVTLAQSSPGHWSWHGQSTCSG